MKSFIYGLLIILIFGVAGFYLFRGAGNLASRLRPSSTPIASLPPSAFDTPVESLAPISTTPPPSPVSTTKGGLIKGTSTVTTATTSSHLLFTLVKTSTCPISYMTEVKDIRGPLTLKYALKDGFSANFNIWRRDGNELIPNTTVRNSGTLATISNVDYFKLRIESSDCGDDDTDWITVTAER